MNESDLTIPESLHKSAKNMLRLQQYHAMMRSAVTDGSRTPPYFTPEQMRRACELLRKEILRDLQRMIKWLIVTKRWQKRSTIGTTRSSLNSRHLK
jgi:hypothetical protein